MSAKVAMPLSTPTFTAISNSTFSFSVIPTGPYPATSAPTAAAVPQENEVPLSATDLERIYGYKVHAASSSHKRSSSRSRSPRGNPNIRAVKMYIPHLNKDMPLWEKISPKGSPVATAMYTPRRANHGVPLGCKMDAQGIMMVPLAVLTYREALADHRFGHVYRDEFKQIIYDDDHLYQ